MHRLRRLHIAAMIAAATTGLLAASIPALPASAASAAVHGVVTDRGRAVAGVRVGWTDPETNAAATARTDARGRFTIDLPRTPGTGFVWAGLRPTEQHAVFTAAGVSYVRAVIGASRPAGAPSALLQTQRQAAPAAIGGGGTIAIHLQRSARLAGKDPAAAGSRILLRRGDGSTVTTVEVGAAGGYRSAALAPGRYAARLRLPGSSVSSAIADVVLRAGGTASLAAGVATRVRHRQSVVAGTVVSPPGVTKRTVRVEARRDGVLVAAVRSSIDGRYVFRGLPAGTCTLLAGRNAPDYDADPSRVHLTPDDTVAVSRTVVVRAATTTRRTLPLGVAGRITGSDAPSAQVLVEDSTGRLLRTTFAAPTGAFTFGGLPTGDHLLITGGNGTFGTATAHVVAGRTTAVGMITPTTPMITARGTVPAVTKSAGEHLNVAADIEGAVPGYDTAFGWGVGGAEPDATGGWSLGHFLPGRWIFVAGSYLSVGRTADSLQHADGARLTRTLDAATGADPIALDLGPTTALLAGSFRSIGGPGLGYMPFGVTASDGSTAGISGNTFDGTVEIGAVPGTYRWPRSVDAVPATDGPWWAIPTDRSVTVSPGIRRDVRIPLTIRG